MQVRRMLLPLMCLLGWLLLGCSADKNTGHREVKWDRDACERCRMVLSDRDYAAQIRYFPDDKKRSRIAVFDDIGCATLWLENKPWNNDPRTEIWVVDQQSGNWIDARQATYITGRMSPMEYGLGAQAEPATDGLTFAQAKQHVLDIEQRFNQHGVHLLHQFKEQAKQRDANLKTQMAEKKLPPIIPESK